MSTPQGTGWTPGDGPVPPWQVPGSTSAPPPAPVWDTRSGAGAPRPPGYAGGAPEVTTTATGAAAGPAADPYAEIDPFRTDGTGTVRMPPTAPGAQYRLDAAPGTWGPPPMWAPPPRTDPLAITSLVLGLVGLLLFPLVLSQVALALGIAAVRRVRRTGEEGFGLAVTGIVAGAVGTLVVLALVGLFASVAWWSL